MKTFHSMFISGALALALAGCGEDAPPPPPIAPRSQSAETPKEQATETAVAGPTYVYNYNPVGKRDPFRSPVADLGGESQQTTQQSAALPVGPRPAAAGGGGHR
jgi:type IV pilus assembly protein PilP